MNMKTCVPKDIIKCYLTDKLFRVVQPIQMQARRNIVVQDRKYHFTSYPRSFLGSDLATFLVDSKFASSPEEALKLAKPFTLTDFLQQA